MTILYSFTSDGGFAVVDTDAHAYVYGYPTSDMQEYARRAGAPNAALANVHRLQETADFIRRWKQHNIGKPCEDIHEEGYQSVFAKMVAPTELTQIQ